MLKQKIESACGFAGLKLKQACDLSGVKYGTLYTQLNQGREVPFSSVQRLSSTLNVPLTFFETAQAESLPQSGQEARKRMAQEINAERDSECRAGFSVTTDHILDWFHKENGDLRNWAWFEDQLDIYHRPLATDAVMRPVTMGHRSITTERFMLNSTSDFLKVVSKFDKAVVDKAMQTHRQLEHVPYIVTDEDLDVVVKGQSIRGGYRKVAMRVTDPIHGPVNAIFSKLTWLHCPQ